MGCHLNKRITKRGVGISVEVSPYLGRQKTNSCTRVTDFIRTVYYPRVLYKQLTD